jgi:DNA polymerase III subunit beta
MRFSILQQDLWPVLQSVSRSVGIRPQLPVLANILLQVEGDKLKLSATNLEIGVVKSVTAEVEEEGDLTIPAKLLSEVVSNLTGEKITFNGNESQLQISTPSFSSTINGISANEFPTIPLSGKEAVRVDVKTLQASVPEVVFAAAVDEARPVLTGILTEFKAKNLELVATDGYRLAHKSVSLSQTGDFKALIPRRTLEEVLRLVGEGQAEEVLISSSEDQNQVIFKFGSTELSSRLIEGTYPNWEKIIPSEFKAKVIVDKNELLKAVKLASVFARSEANIVKLTNKTDRLVLSSSAKELGSQVKEVEATSEGEELEIAFNTKFLLDVLNVIHTSRVVLDLSGNLSAAVLKPEGETGVEYIVMPVNLS